MFWNNPMYEASKLEEDWAKYLAQNMMDNSEWLWVQIINWQNIIESCPNFNNFNSSSHINEKTWEKLNINQINLLKWYNLNNNTYKYDKLQLNSKDKTTLKEIKADKYDTFKWLVEVVAWKLLKEYIESFYKNNEKIVTVKITSEYDDLKSWVDCIVQIKDKISWNISIQWIDIAVTTNDSYLNKKRERTQTYCWELNLSNWDKFNKEIPRRVLEFEPSVFANFMKNYLNQVIDWEDLNPMDNSIVLDEYRKNYFNYHNNEVNYTKLTSDNIKTKTNKKVRNILYIN